VIVLVFVGPCNSSDFLTVVLIFSMCHKIHLIFFGGF
jgi:hypothetical protein